MATSRNGAPPRPHAALPVTLAMLNLGFTAVVAQIVLMRELIVVFEGNEMTIGMVLATWLLCTAGGAALVGRWFPWSSRPRVAALQAAVAVVLPLSIVAARTSRSLFGATPGELVGPGAVLALSLLCLSPVCLLAGWLFSAGSRLYAREAGASVATATGTVYLFEAAGSAAGGLLASVLLLRFCTDLQLAVIVALVNLLGGAILAGRTATHRIALGGAALALGIAMFLAAPLLDTASLARLWPGFRLIATRNSIYGNLAVVEAEGSRSLYENGLIAFTGRDRAAAEESVHFALLEHAAPQSVLLIGGGVNGSLAEALQHPSVTRIDYVELDPAVLAITRDYFPEAWAAFADPRVRVHSLDGRLFLKTTAGTYDVIVVSLPDPQTAQLNRFYTREFFAEAASKLNPGGIVSLSVRGAENYLSPELGDLLRCLNRSLHEVFPAVSLVPGDTVHFSAARSSAALAGGPSVIIARLRERRLDTLYVSESYLPFRMSAERMRQFREQMQAQPQARVNRDFAPVAYYYAMARWIAQFRTGLRGPLRRLVDLPFAAVLAGALLLAGLVTAACFRGAGALSARAPAALCVGASGFTLMSLEILLLLGFQAIYGYVYYQLALVIAAFMTGLALGSWCKQPGTDRQRMRTLAVLQLAAAASPLLLYLALLGCTTAVGMTPLKLISGIAFPAMAVASGMLGGYQFRVGSGVYFGSGDSQRPGALYGIDLLGASLGAILVSTYLLPVFGMSRTAWVIAAVNMPPALLATLATVRRPAVRNVAASLPRTPAPRT